MKTEIKPYWEYKPVKKIENKDAMLMWDRTIYTNRTVAHNRPDIVLKDKKEKITYLIDVAVPGTNDMVNTIRTKIDKYRELAEEIQRTWRTRREILPIVITATGVVPAKTVENMQQLGDTGTEMRAMQKAVILYTTRIVRKVTGEE